jgi:sulfur carrier protein ThiS
MTIIRTMKIKIQVIGFNKDQFPPAVKGSSFELSLEKPISLHNLLDTILQIHTLEKVVLINGSYHSPDYSLQDGDSLQILPMLDGG